MNYNLRTHKTRKQTIDHADKPKNCLLKHINNSPGMGYRYLRVTGFANGVLAYHLKILDKLKRIQVSRYHERKNTRYYPLNTTSEKSRIMEYVRRTTTRRQTSNDMRQHTKKGGPTISRQLSWLRKAG
jgi:predicted transcriptional regulator